MENEQPTSLAVLNSGKVVVADYNHNQLLFYNKEGEIEFQLDGMKPYSIAVDHTGNVLVGDRKNKTVKLFSPSGDHLSEFGSYGTRDKQLAMADFLTVDSNDRIIVCDSGNHCVKVFDREGKLLLMFGGRGRLKGELQWPKGICVDDKDNIIVADTKNNRVCMFSPEGEYIQRVVKNIPNAYAVSFTKPNQLGVTQFTMNGESEFKVFKIEEKLGDLTLDSEL
ncbi:hypothetical protein CAPTEDRAFT_181303 [Capitella teleta]|uniref:SMP-30/Gluconolactonase/LRE-like region domain-containing protein n=1 Tax=Capitella teleta TaxID=283909 RepID=R7UHK3_CAPTE|nr:hypothetical protein CAPTEDRAFT_181303 [Capitella teleta]|eukprot:ELU03293.1 hypothetical protein CAPTEDRAFT_181303 [Capitella teleta]